MNDYEELRKNGYVGFAHLYLEKTNIPSSFSVLSIIYDDDSDDKIDIQAYTKLLQLDTKLGITASEQLQWCLNFTTRSDIIEVKICALNQRFKII